MLTSQDLKFLLDLAKSAPLQRAGDAPVVAALFARIETTIVDGERQAVIDDAMKKMESQVAATPPQTPAQPAPPGAQPPAVPQADTAASAG